jgi:hypothetical protein
MDVRKDVDEYAQIMQKQKRILQDVKKKQGQRPHDRKGRDVMLLEFMMASMASAQMAKSTDTYQTLLSFVPRHIRLAPPLSMP